MQFLSYEYTLPFAGNCFNTINLSVNLAKIKKQLINFVMKLKDINKKIILRMSIENFQSIIYILAQ